MRRSQRRIEPYTWLGAGAVAVGLSAAALHGAGVAAADEKAGPDPSSATSSTDDVPNASAADDAVTDEDAESAEPVDEVVDEVVDDEDIVEDDEPDEEIVDDDESDEKSGATRGSRRDTTPDENAADGPESAVDDEAAADHHDDTLDIDDDAPPTWETSYPVADTLASDHPETSAGPVESSDGASPKTIATTLRSGLVDEPTTPADPLAWMLFAALANSAPTATLRRQSAPSIFSGRVTGTITATDPEGDRLTYSGTTTTKGTVTVTSRGTFTYTPTAAARHAAASATATAADKNDTFAITVSDGNGGTVEVPITVVIKPANSAPSWLRSTKSTADPLSGVVTGRITASDRDGDTFSYSATAPKAGTVTLNADGTFTYTATEAARQKARATWYSDSDSFKVTVDDGHGGSKTVAIRVAIAPKNSAPTVGTPTFSTNTSTGVVTGKINAVDPDGDRFSYAAATATTAKGTLKVRSDGTFTFTPTAAARHAAATGDPATTHNFGTVKVQDRFGAAANIIVAVPISPTNSVPRDLTATVSQPDPVTGVVTGTLNGHDPDGDTLTYSPSATTQKGDVVVEANGHFTYRPTEAARAAAASDTATAADKADSFSVIVSDGHGGTVLATVQVSVAPTFSNTDDVLAPAELHGLVTSSVVEVVQNDNGTVRVIDGSFTGVRVHNADDAAKVFNQIAGLLGAESDFADADHVTVRSVTQETEDGSFTETYYRLVQAVNGVSTLGGELILVADGSGTVTAVFNRYDARVGSTDTTATVDRDAAEGTVTADILDLLSEELSDDAVRQQFLASLKYRTELVIDNIDARKVPRLVWQIVVWTPDPDPEVDTAPAATLAISTRYFVYANGDGAGQIADGSTTGGVHALTPARDSARDRLNVLRYFNIQQTGDISVLIDSVRNIKTFFGSAPYDAGEKDVKTGTFVKEGSGWDWDPVVGFYSWDPSAVSAHANMAFVFDYYKNTLGKKKFDFADRYGLATGIKVILVDDSYRNASYFREHARFVFAMDTEAAMDVVAHEFTHAVIGDIVGRDATYGLEGNLESEALNEAYADILGGLIEIGFDPTAERWTMGEDSKCGKGGNPACRNMAAPMTYSDAVKANDPHELMAVFNYASYRMMTQYAATSNIPASKWARVFYNSLGRLTFGAGFAQAANAVLSSAKAQGFSGAELSAVEDAFRQAEILTPSGYVPPAPQDPVTVPVDGVTLPGHSNTEAILNASGSRALLSTLYYPPSGTGLADDQHTKVVLIDTATGQQVGKVLTVRGGSLAKFNAEGTRVVVAAVEGHDDGTATSRVTVLSAATGNPIGPTLTLSAGVHAVEFNAAGTSAILATSLGNSNETAVSQVLLVNLTTGRQVGPTLQLPGSGNIRVIEESSNRATLGATFFETDGTTTSRFLFFDTNTGLQVGPSHITDGYGADVVNEGAARVTSIRTADGITTVTVFDTVTGTQVGGTTVVDGWTTGSSWTTPAVDAASGMLVLITESDQGVIADQRVHVSVIDTMTGRQVGSTLHLGSGLAWNMHLDGSGRVVVAMRRTNPTTFVNDTRIVTIDLATGTQAATSAWFAGSMPYGSQLVGDGSRIFLSLSDDRTNRTTLAVLDTRSGSQVGPGLTLAGDGFTGVKTDGTRAVVLTSAGSVAFFDLRTGTQIGSVSTVSGAASVALSADGTRAAVTSRRFRPGGGAIAWRVSVFDTRTGEEIGGSAEIAGNDGNGGAQFSADGGRVVLGVDRGNSGNGSSTVAVIDARTGVQLGENITVAGTLLPIEQNAPGAVTFSADGTRAVFTTEVTESRVTYTQWTTNAVIIDLTTGSQVGPTLSIDGEQRGWLRMSPRDHRAVITTGISDDKTTQTQTVVIDTASGEVLT